MFLRPLLGGHALPSFHHFWHLFELFLPFIHFTAQPLIIKVIPTNNTSTWKNISIAKWKRQVNLHCLKEGAFSVLDSCVWAEETNRKARSAKSFHFWIISFSYPFARGSHAFQNIELFFRHMYTCNNWDKYIWDFCWWRREYFSQLFKERHSLGLLQSQSALLMQR